MDFEELRAFLAIVDTGSFLAAANELGIPRATLRRRVDALEARIGAPLVDRSPKGAVLTDAGALLAKQGRRLVQSSSALLTAVREVAREPVGDLHISLPIGLPPDVLSAMFLLLRGVLPKVAVDLRFHPNPTAHGLLDDVDVAVHFGDESPAGWIAHELMRVRVRLFAHADHLARRGTPKSPAQLAEHTLLAWSGPSVDPFAWPLADGSQLRVAPTLISNDAHLVRQTILARAGIGLVPDANLPDPDIASGKLVPVLDGVVGRELALRVVVPALLTGSPKVARLVEVAQEFLRRSVR
ncbi:MAG TPA: LysR family transcriptional regulator [Enhygromyxa sp.]|nr:LysR family transcriptional regulator [Enhygromyxa sp.]